MKHNIAIKAKNGWIRTENINMSQSEALNARELGFDVKACGLVIESHESWDGVLESWDEQRMMFKHGQSHIHVKLRIDQIHKTLLFL